MDAKIINLGLHKTGTTSLAKALRRMGFAADHFDTGLVADDWHGDRGAPCGATFDPDALRSPSRLDAADATCDFPACLPAVWWALDERFPGSKFILTTRPPDRWARSVAAHQGHPYYRRQFAHRRAWPGYDPRRDVVFSRDVIGTAEAIYRVPYARQDESVFLPAYERHVADVRSHFAGRPGDLLELDVSAPDATERLAAFVGRPAPPGPFPRENRRPGAIAELAWSARRWVGDLLRPVRAGRR